MRWSVAPLPGWNHLFKGVWPYCMGATLPELSLPWRRGQEESYWFSKSAVSLWAIVRWWQKNFCRAEVVLWVPEYFCAMSLAPLENSNVRIVHYPITEKLLPNWQQCDEMAGESKPDLFIFVHYFGMCLDARQARRFCDRCGALLIEDAAHVLVPIGDIGTQGDFVCYSPHKLLAIPDGALLLHRTSTKANRNMRKSPDYVSMDEIIQQMPSRAPAPSKWLIKRLVQKLLPDWIFAWRRLPTDDFHQDPAACGNQMDTPQPSSFGQYLLAAQLPDLDRLAYRRRENASVLSAIFSRMSDTHLAIDQTNSTPYHIAISSESAESIEQIYARLRRNGVPVQTWPDLPSEIGRGSTAFRLRHSTLYAPCHQSLAPRTLMNMAGNSCSWCQDRYELQWFDGQQGQWDEFLTSCGKSNLMQSWSYGQAKKYVECWKPVRALVRRNGEPVAIFQALQKGVGPFAVVRINRGPLFLGEDNDFGRKLGVLRAVKQTLSLKSGRILLIAPELMDRPENSSILSILGYHRRDMMRWCSAWVDLQYDEDLLRKRLKGKWRNQLRSAERSGLSLKIDDSDDGFDWLMARHQNMMDEKGFLGSSVALIAEYRRQAKGGGGKDTAILFCALDSSGERVAAVLFARHGDACTYWIGWSNEDGRRLYASNFLLWNAMLEMRRCGCSWFDVGGVDLEHTPSIARFKAGLGGEMFTNLGEYRVAW